MNAREEDAAYRRAWGTNGRRPWGRPLRAAFYAELPESPRGRWVSIDDCKRYLGRLREVYEMGCWTSQEVDRLKALMKRWERRVRGEDARFTAMGVQPGLNERFRKKTTRDTMAQIREVLK